MDCSRLIYLVSLALLYHFKSRLVDFTDPPIQRSYEQVVLMSVTSIFANFVYTLGPPDALYPEGSAACSTQGDTLYLFPIFITLCSWLQLRNGTNVYVTADDT